VSRQKTAELGYLDPATLSLWALAALLIAGGLAGLVLPALPGAPLVFAGVLVAAWAEDFAHIGLGSLTAIGVLAALAVLVDFVAGAVGARRYGASGRAAVGAAIGATVGIFFGLVGVLIGPFIGAVLGELSAQRDLDAAGRAGIGATVGFVLGTAAKLALGFTMIGIALVARLM
jgi:uncharacterized protein YqgC (DUF456 family)